MDKEIVIVIKEGVIIKMFDGEVVERVFYIVEFDVSDIEKGMYFYYMLKEIDE